MAKDDKTADPGSNSPLFTTEDLAAFKEIRPNLSPGGRNLVDLLVKIFGAETSPTDLAGVVQNLGSSGTDAVDMLYSLYTLMNGPLKPK